MPCRGVPVRGARKRETDIPYPARMTLTEELAYLTADVPGVGGRIKQRHEDFLVEEQPLYEPCGEGEHLYLFIEKDGLTTTEAIRRIARAFRVSRREIGYAGLKDKHAVTRQHVSLHLPGGDARADEQSVARLEQQQRIKLLWHARHGNKLRRGHHAGNRFVIYIRDVEATAVLRARPILDRLEREGVPNYFGEQRFGYRANGQTLGRLLLLGEHRAFLDELLGRPEPHESQELREARTAYDRGEIEAALERWPRSLRFDRQALDALRQHRSDERAVASVEASHRRLLVSAFQSGVFNRVLDRRIRAGAFPKLIEGDLAWKHEGRAVFEADAEAVRADNAAGGAGRAAGGVAVGPDVGQGHAADPRRGGSAGGRGAGGGGAVARGDAARVAGAGPDAGGRAASDARAAAGPGDLRRRGRARVVRARGVRAAAGRVRDGGAARADEERGDPPGVRGAEPRRARFRGPGRGGGARFA